ncbi:MAG TPA: preprotein translocase subunit SecG [Chitinophagales bacterium]|nr:preprotein translocase subunit SecG [Chitinophagales bacterium]
MYIFITLIIVVIAVLIMLIILVQNPKGGGLGAASQVMGGVKQTTDFLEKATWTLAIALFVLSIFSNAFLPSERPINNQGTETKIENLLDEE